MIRSMSAKICFISGAIAHSGGTERVGCIIANELSAKGYDVTILSFWNWGPPFFSVSEKVRVKYLLDPQREGKLYRTYIYPILKLHHFIISNDIDIVIDIDTQLARFSSYAIQGTKCKQISWEHFNYWAMVEKNDKRWFKAKRLIKKYASKLVVLTEQDRLKHIEMYNFRPEFVVTMPNPCLSDVDVDYHFDNKTFLAVGRLTKQKRFDLLLDAWKMVQPECPAWKLVIVGTGDLEIELKNQAEKNNLENLIFAGHTNQVEKYYQSASCLVLSSEFEGFPMVVLEAFSYGLPVISFDCKTGPSDMISDGENGFLVENGNVEKLAERMIVFTKHCNNANQMSLNASKMIQKYKLDSIISRWCELISELI